MLGDMTDLNTLFLTKNTLLSKKEGNGTCVLLLFTQWRVEPVAWEEELMAKPETSPNFLPYARTLTPNQPTCAPRPNCKTASYKHFRFAGIQSTPTDITDMTLNNLEMAKDRKPGLL